MLCHQGFKWVDAIYDEGQILGVTKEQADPYRDIVLLLTFVLHLIGPMTTVVAESIHGLLQPFRLSEAYR